LLIKVACAVAAELAQQRASCSTFSTPRHHLQVKVVRQVDHHPYQLAIFRSTPHYRRPKLLSIFQHGDGQAIKVRKEENRLPKSSSEERTPGTTENQHGLLHPQSHGASPAVSVNSKLQPLRIHPRSSNADG
jgi:hypothetical protein